MTFWIPGSSPQVLGQRPRCVTIPGILTPTGSQWHHPMWKGNLFRGCSRHPWWCSPPSTGPGEVCPWTQLCLTSRNTTPEVRWWVRTNVQSNVKLYLSDLSSGHFCVQSRRTSFCPINEKPETTEDSGKTAVVFSLKNEVGCLIKALNVFQVRPEFGQDPKQGLDQIHIQRQPK